MGDVLYLGVAVFVLGTTLVGLLRALRGPTPADRMMAAMLLGTAGVAILLLLAQHWAAPALRDVALLFGLLAAVTTIAFVRRAWVSPSKGAGEDDDDR
jgi:multicomponent Na+:H+ antiporter subunit F